MDLKQLSAVNWDDMEWEIVRPGVKRKVLQAEGGTVVLNYLEPVHEPRPHTHVHEQIVYIIQGECDFPVGDRVFKLRAGSVLAVPPHLEHYARVTGKETLINMDLFIPRRDDYHPSKIKEKK